MSQSNILAIWMAIAVLQAGRAAFSTRRPGAAVRSAPRRTLPPTSSSDRRIAVSRVVLTVVGATSFFLPWVKPAPWWTKGRGWETSIEGPSLGLDLMRDGYSDEGTRAWIACLAVFILGVDALRRFSPWARTPRMHVTNAELVLSAVPRAGLAGLSLLLWGGGLLDLAENGSWEAGAYLNAWAFLGFVFVEFVYVPWSIGEALQRSFGRAARGARFTWGADGMRPWASSCRCARA